MGLERREYDGDDEGAEWGGKKLRLTGKKPHYLVKYG